jgi:hypothetical protein
MKKLSAIVLLIAMLSACAPTVTETPVPLPTMTATASSTPMPAALWISPAVPPVLRETAQSWGIPRTDDPSLATLRLDPVTTGTTLWIYALVAPFPTITDNVTFDELQLAWGGAPSGTFSGRPLWMAESTLAAFTVLWGEPANGSVRTADADQLLAAAWADQPSWAIIPFEEIQPRWKVLSVNSQSPIRKDFDPLSYSLKIIFSLQSSNVQHSTFNIPTTNRDPEKLTTVILTGVTALVDTTAYMMESKGITYPGRLIRDWLREADILHVSNEVPFDEECPFPTTGQEDLNLCSRPQYIDLLLDVGTDVVEMSGDHFADRGSSAMLETLALYKEKGILYYGGGANLEESKQPLFMERGGNRFMFIGCNAKHNYPHASETMPGAAPCDRDYMTARIRIWSSQGFIPIVTFQHYEYYSPEARPGQLSDFHQMADAGAAVVSGSQAHFAQMMEFHGDAFLHYGLGNLFYLQMWYDLPNGTRTENTRREFFDRHVFYDGRYLGVELLTAMLEEFSSPRPMTPAERAVFLNEYFYYSGWMDIIPTPVPAPTLTLTPLWIPTFDGTPAWPPTPYPTSTPRP